MVSLQLFQLLDVRIEFVEVEGGDVAVLNLKLLLKTANGSIEAVLAKGLGVGQVELLLDRLFHRRFLLGEPFRESLNDLGKTFDGVEDAVFGGGIGHLSFLRGLLRLRGCRR